MQTAEQDANDNDNMEDEVMVNTISAADENGECLFSTYGNVQLMSWSKFHVPLLLGIKFFFTFTLQKNVMANVLTIQETFGQLHLLDDQDGDDDNIKNQRIGQL